MMGPITINLRGNEAITKPEMNAWVAWVKGPQVGQTMQRLGWQLARGPAATVVVGLEWPNGTQLQGSRWVVKGKLEEVRVKELELWGKGDLEEVFKNLQWVSSPSATTMFP